MSILKTFNKTRRGKREIVLDIETTGFLTKEGHRIVEVAAVEMMGRKLTGREFRALVNPERDIPVDVIKVHGISNDKVKDSPVFGKVAAHLREFIGSDPIIITCRTIKDDKNQDYVLDSSFLNMEMEKAGISRFSDDQWINVRRWSEAMFGEKAATLDKVLDKYDISRKERDDNGHSAILDARLLAEAYPKLLRDYAKFKEEKAVAAAKSNNKPNP